MTYYAFPLLHSFLLRKLINFRSLSARRLAMRFRASDNSSQISESCKSVSRDVLQYVNSSNQRCWQRKRGAIYERKRLSVPAQSITAECSEGIERNAMQKHKESSFARLDFIEIFLINFCRSVIYWRGHPIFPMPSLCLTHSETESLNGEAALRGISSWDWLRNLQQRMNKLARDVEHQSRLRAVALFAIST